MLRDYNSVGYDDFHYIRSQKKLIIEEINNGVILPCIPKISLNGPRWGLGGVLDESENYVPLSGFNASWVTFGGKYDFNNKNIEYLNEQVLYFGVFESHWGHFLVDFIGRMWYILNHYNGQKIVYVSKYSRMKGNFLEFMNYLGVPENKLIKIQAPTKFKSIIIPEYSNNEEGYTSLYKEIFDRVIKSSNYFNNNIKITENIYFTRLNFSISKQKEYGEKTLAKILVENKSQLLSPETFSLKDQIYIWNNAKRIVCINGTIPLNIIFCRNKEVELVVLNKTSITHPNIYNFLQISGHENVIFIDVFYERLQAKAKNLGYGPFFIYNTNEFQRYCLNNGLINKEESSKTHFIKLHIFFIWYKFFNHYRLVSKVKGVTEVAKSMLITRIRKIRNRFISG